MPKALLRTSMRSRRACLALSAWALCVALVGCVEDLYSQVSDSDTGKQVAAAPTPSAPPVAGTTQSSVLIYMKSVTVKKYGFLAHVSGYRDSSESLTVYDPAKEWWARPALLYADAPISDPDAVGGADGVVMKGIGSSSNVNVTVALTCHADAALKTLPKADCIKGTIRATLTASAGFFEGGWTDVVTVKDKPFVFTIDTSDKSRRLKPTGTERRTIQLSFEAYTRGRQRWAPKTEWPESPERADVRVVLYAKDAQLEVTGSRYDDSSSTAPKE